MFKPIIKFFTFQYKDPPELIQKLFSYCSDSLQSKQDLFELLDHITNINTIQEISNVMHNLLTCYITYHDDIDFKIIEKMVKRGIDLEYTTHGAYNGAAIMLYLLKPNSNDIDIINLLSYENIHSSYYYINTHNLHNLITAYLQYNFKANLQVLTYLMAHGVDLFFTSTFESKSYHNALSAHLVNKEVSLDIIKKLTTYNVLRDHIIIDINSDTYNIVTWYIKSTNNIDNQILMTLLETGCKTQLDQKLMNYKHNALLFYLKNTKEPDINVINILMNKIYEYHVRENTLIYTKERVFNILTWYIYNKVPSLQILEHLCFNNVNIHFIDNRCNNICELYLQQKDISLNILKYLYSKNVKFTEYCMTYYLQNNKEKEREIISYLLDVCELVDHTNWELVEGGRTRDNLVSLYPDLNKISKLMPKKSYFQLFCVIS